MCEKHLIFINVYLQEKYFNILSIIFNIPGPADIYFLHFILYPLNFFSA